VELPVDRFTWANYAACREHPDPDVFFPRRGRNDTAAKARWVCDGCPVRMPCLVYAVLAKEDVGIWGGTTPNARAEIRRRLVSSGHDLREARGLSHSAALMAAQ
jgi:WhiB family transcriptional regulator, redox-sensing transcriptional regulator